VRACVRACVCVRTHTRNRSNGVSRGGGGGKKARRPNEGPKTNAVAKRREKSALFMDCAPLAFNSFLAAFQPLPTLYVRGNNLSRVLLARERRSAPSIGSLIKDYSYESDFFSFMKLPLRIWRGCIAPSRLSQGTFRVIILLFDTRLRYFAR
jgi:hypothetical protein